MGHPQLESEDLRLENLVLKHDDIFMSASRDGDLRNNGGLFYRDTRFLSDYRLLLGDRPPLMLKASDERSWSVQIVQMSAPLALPDGRELPAGTVRIYRQRLIHGAMIERITLISFAAEPIRIPLEIQVAADFADIFEVRGTTRARRGVVNRPEMQGDTLVLSYLGLDGVERRTEVRCTARARQAAAVHLPGGSAAGAVPGAALRLDLELAPQQAVTFEVFIRIVVRCSGNAAESFAYGLTMAKPPAILPFDLARTEMDGLYRAWKESIHLPATGDAAWQRALERGLLDLRLLITDLGYGPLVTAGVPWFAVPFGRDSIIAALQLLPYNQEVARGTLRTLAAFQGSREDPARDEEPGKIIHEMRRGEMAELGEIVFGRYYGSVDSTLLFLVLLYETFLWTRDLELCRELRPAMDRAIAWAERYGDRDGDGYIEYHSEADGGLCNQGWKDSHDAISHRTGELAQSPIALCEVQGYYYRALVGVAAILVALGESGKVYTRRAAELKTRFNRDFWMPDRSYIALGLDREKRQIGVVTSNPGHCLWTRILEPDRAAAVARMLIGGELWTGWGLRTLSRTERLYNPGSYHNGSVWPHDTAIAVHGLARYRYLEEANCLAKGLIAAASHFSLGRLPELFCGDPREDGEGPVPYPVACSPQAWAAGAPLMLWQAVAGLEPGRSKGGDSVKVAEPSQCS